MTSSLTSLAKEENLHEMLDFIEGIGVKLGLQEKSLFRLKLIAEEIIVNVIKYAYPAEEGSVTIQCETDPQKKIIVTVINSGIQFNPLEKESPDTAADADSRPIGGLGIFLTREMSDSVEYRYKDGKNILSFTLQIDND
jgi:anti-sigma regulatory factor (Ser/Thr protein kinase)